MLQMFQQDKAASQMLKGIRAKERSVREKYSIGSVDFQCRIPPPPHPSCLNGEPAYFKEMSIPRYQVGIATHFPYKFTSAFLRCFRVVDLNKLSFTCFRLKARKDSTWVAAPTLPRFTDFEVRERSKLGRNHEVLDTVYNLTFCRLA